MQFHAALTDVKTDANVIIPNIDVYTVYGIRYTYIYIYYIYNLYISSLIYLLILLLLSGILDFFWALFFFKVRGVAGAAKNENQK